MEPAKQDTSPKKRRRRRRSHTTPKWLTEKADLDEVARNRVLMFLSVISGEKTVTTAIEESGISRNLYYQLETKALNAMLLALAPGADGDPSTDAAGYRHRISELEAKLQRTEQGQRRAERLLHMHRKLTPGPMKTRRGRPPKQATSSTRAGRKGWRSSTTTISDRKPRKPRVSKPTSGTPKTASSPTTKSASAPSIPTTAGSNADPSGGNENSLAPTP